MTTAKPSTRKTPTKRADEPSMVDQLAEDVEQVDVPTEYPPGTPEFKVLLAVRPRTRRAEFKRLLGELAEKSATMRRKFAEVATLEDDDRREVASYELSADLDEFLEVVERALRLVAVDVEQFDAWVAEVSDEDLQTTWAVYQQRAQPGEAPSSTS